MMYGQVDPRVARQMLKGPIRVRHYDTTWRVTVRDGPLSTVKIENGVVMRSGAERRIVAEGLARKVALAMARDVKGLRAERVRGSLHSELRERTPGRAAPVVGWLRP
jgi:hypothetical protein